MNKITNKNRKKILKTSKKQFDTLLKICLIIGIIIVSGFIIYYVLTPEPGYVAFMILNENQKAEKYPTEAAINESISFYLTVGNYLNRDFTFQIQIKKGNNNTILSSSIPSNGTLDFTIGNITLNHNVDWISQKLNVSFSEVGQNQIIIAELWQIRNEVEEFYNNVFLRLNITN
ncbi:MAG: DUF1616 domain-containing protein [Promethearchaeota archaeon]|nr:MAG: DUF1616 domain-containing protein [Candidatus Lokiarchaeota archaeon]